MRRGRWVALLIGAGVMAGWLVYTQYAVFRRVVVLEEALAPLHREFPAVHVTFSSRHRSESVRYVGEVEDAAAKQRLIVGLDRKLAGEAGFLCRDLRFQNAGH